MPLLMPFEPLRGSPYWMLTLEPQPIGQSILLLVPLVSCFVYIFISYLFTLYHHFCLQFFFITDRIVEGALNAAKAAFPLIDMTKHKGEHPRYYFNNHLSVSILRFLRQKLILQSFY